MQIAKAKSRAMLTRTAKKHVRFACGSDSVREVTMASGPCDQLWYSRDDFVTFRSLATTCGDWMSNGKVSRALDVLGSKHCNQIAMDYWSYFGASGRGFECLVNPILGAERHKQKMRCIKAVLIAQVVSQQHAEAGMEIDKERFIAFVSSKESRLARKFALMMGKADEKATHHPTTIQQTSSNTVAPSA